MASCGLFALIAGLLLLLVVWMPWLLVLFVPAGMWIGAALPRRQGQVVPKSPLSPVSREREPSEIGRAHV